jgi:Uma2 family endonuclease
MARIFLRELKGGSMTWQEVCDDKSLQDLPYKIELDQWGRIVMSPASNRRGRNKVRIGVLLENLFNAGEIVMSCVIDTPMGTKVADVAWASDAFIQKHGYDTPYSVAPEICVEVKSLYNTGAEIAEKVMLYLSKGAQEVWICAADGNMSFHDHTGKLAQSKLAPGFPTAV